MIPQQLIDAGARVVLIRPMRKGTHVKDWGTTGNLSATDPDLISHFRQGGNYGVLSHNGICMIDIDDPVKFREAEIKLPASFAVERGNSKRGHYYFTCNDCPDENREISTVSFGDIRLGGNHYVVGPGSIHPTGDVYHVRDNIPIVDIKFEIIKEIIDKHGKLGKKRTVAPRMASYNSGFISDKLGLRCMDIAPPINPTYNGDEVKGAHPVHHSKTGTDFSINTRDNLWHCWNHKTGGDALMLYAMSKGIIDCKEAQRGCLKGRWAEIFAELKHDGYDLVKAGIEDPVFGKREEIRELLESLGVF